MSVNYLEPDVVNVQRRQQLSPLLTGLGALYVALLINHTVLQPDLRAAPLVFLGSATALLFVGSRWLLSHRDLSPAWSESLSSALAGAVILHGMLHLYLLSSFSETRNLVLLAVGIVAFFLPLKRLTLVLIVTLTTWVIVALVAGPSISWLYFAFGLFMATGLKLYTVLNNSGVSQALDTATQIQTRCRQAEEQAEQTSSLFTSAIDSSEEGFWQWNFVTDAFDSTPQFAQMLGLEEPPTQAARWLERVRGSQRHRLLQLHKSLTPARPRFEEELEVLHADQKYRWMRVSGTASFDADGKLVSLAGWQSDITQFRTIQRKLYQRSFRDELTGLSNRQHFLRQIHEALKQTQRTSPEYGIVVLVLDVDRFRRQVDRFGYIAGDRILKAVSQRLQSRSGAASVARLEADRFGLLFSRLPNPLAAQGVASSVRQVMTQPFGDESRALHLSVTMGLAWGQEGVSPELLLCRAHDSMRHAKAQGPGRYAIFDEESETKHNRQLELEFRVGDALRHSELKLVYQPITALKNGGIVGVAAQLRWNHPSRGLLFPEQFAAAVHASGLEGAVAWWTMREGCRKLREWLSKNPANSLFSVSLPAAARQFSDLGAVDRVFGILEECGLSPEALRLEVTEAIIDSQPGNVLPMLSDLQDGGVQIHLAQFGTRYASPAILERFGFDALKIAPYFMESIDENRQKLQTVKALLRLAQEMALDVIAEGLDSARQVDIMESLGCDYGQGGFFWPAMDPEMMAVILDEPALADGASGKLIQMPQVEKRN